MRPTEALKEEHRVIERGLTALEAAAEELSQGQEVPKDALEALLDFVRDFADGCHHQKEEGILFPYLEARGMPRDMGPIGVMLEEHDIGRKHVQAMAEALEERDQKAFMAHARAYVDLLRDHIAKEDDVLFPMADQLMAGSEEQRLMADFERAEEELEGSHERYLDVLAQVEKALGIRRPSEDDSGRSPSASRNST